MGVANEDLVARDGFTAVAGGRFPGEGEMFVLAAPDALFAFVNLHWLDSPWYRIQLKNVGGKTLPAYITLSNFKVVNFTGQKLL